MGQRLSFLIAMAFLQVLSASSRAHAQDVELTLNLIANTADRLCGVVTQTGSATSTEAKGVVKVELNGLASQLVTAGVQGSGGITTDAYQGLVRDQLGPVLHDTTVCKLRVFEILQVKLLPGYAYPLVVRTSQPRPPVVRANLPCQKDQVFDWLDQHGIYGEQPFDISAYDDNVNWIVNGKQSWKKRSDIGKEEDIFRRLYPSQRYSPTTSTASMIGGQCVLTQEVEGYKKSATGKAEFNKFRFGFSIKTDTNGPRIVERQTDLLSR